MDDACALPTGAKHVRITGNRIRCCIKGQVEGSCGSCSSSTLFTAANSAFRNQHFTETTCAWTNFRSLKRMLNAAGSPEAKVHIDNQTNQPVQVSDLQSLACHSFEMTQVKYHKPLEDI